MYGVIHNLSDLIRVKHNTGSLNYRLFEITSYDKSFNDGRVVLTAEDVENAYGAGNSEWSATCIPTTQSINSGFSYYGPIGSLTKLAFTVEFPSVPGTVLSNATRFAIVASGLYGNPETMLSGNLLCFGSVFNCYSEIVYVKSVERLVNSLLVYAITVERGMFNTIPRTYFPTESLYFLGPPSVNSQTGVFSAPSIFGTTYRTATSNLINPNLGTCFKFF